MKLSEEYFKIIDSYRLIRSKLYIIVYNMHPMREDVDIEIKHFSQIGWNKDEMKTLRVWYNAYENDIDYTANEAEIPIEWLDLDDDKLKTTVRKYLYEKELKKKQLEAEAREENDRREYERLKKKYEG